MCTFQQVIFCVGLVLSVCINPVDKYGMLVYLCVCVFLVGLVNFFGNMCVPTGRFLTVPIYRLWE